MDNIKPSDKPWLRNHKSSEEERQPGVNRNSSIADFEREIRLIMDELATLAVAKQRDYGPKNISNSPYGPIQGLVVRIYDKIARIVNLTKNDLDPENESLEDSFKDLANYGVIGLMVLRNKWDR
jgi:hypothetical protein